MKLLPDQIVNHAVRGARFLADARAAAAVNQQLGDSPDERKRASRNSSAVMIRSSPTEAERLERSGARTYLVQELL